jgi:hypothetical protein
MDIETSVEVEFGTGAELLVSYWGYLTGGGLIIGDRGYSVGDLLALQVSIASSSSRYKLYGTVVKRSPEDGKAIVAFRPGEAHDMLLSEALAESDDVAPRRHPRFPTRRQGRAVAGEQSYEVEIINVSREGCCLCLRKEDADRLPIDSEVSVELAGVCAIGVVVWSRNRERGIHLSADEALPLLEEARGDLC